VRKRGIGLERAAHHTGQAREREDLEVEDLREGASEGQLSRGALARRIAHVACEGKQASGAPTNAACRTSNALNMV
jgi:hypothetical protein